MYQRVTDTKSIPWGYSTDFYKVSCVIIDFAKNDEIHPSKMPETVIVFIDMQFDEDSRDAGPDTVYKEVKANYESNR